MTSEIQVWCMSSIPITDHNARWTVRRSHCATWRRPSSSRGRVPSPASSWSRSPGRTGSSSHRMGEVMKRHHQELRRKHPSVGLTRSIGLFGILELVKDRKTMEPLAPFNGTSEPMKAVAKSLRDQGLYTFTRWHTIMTNPPLCINEEELAEGFAIIDRALDIADQAVA